MASRSLKALAALRPILIWLLLASLSWAPSPLPPSLCYSHMGCSLNTPERRTLPSLPQAHLDVCFLQAPALTSPVHPRPPFTLLSSQPSPSLLLVLIPTYLALRFLCSVHVFPPNTLDAFIIVFMVCLFFCGNMNLTMTRLLALFTVLSKASRAMLGT